MNDNTNNNFLERRNFFKKTLRLFLLFLLTGFFFNRLAKIFGYNYAWQIDPLKCKRCGRCASNCVLNPSAVKCVHTYEVCGYCNLCFGYFLPEAKKLTEDAENQICPTNAIKRKFIEDPYFEYNIDESLCIGCGKCVSGCNLFGNGSLHLQVRHNICLNCNECSIALNCPSNAFVRVPVKNSYIKNKI